MSEENKKLQKTRGEKEREILEFWRENKVFETSEQKPAPKGDFVFYDGPPFATGLPHYGHMLPATIKDVIPRFKTMQGFRVRRRWGWDCHGLPVENLIEKELGLKDKQDILKYGIGKFNVEAKNSVLRYADDWRERVPRWGRWIDMEQDYRTMDLAYTESIWWMFKTLYEKNLITEGYKSMHLCPRCETTLSNFEVNQGYKDITDISVYVAFELSDTPNTFLLAWTTTPWTLPGNVALAVHPDVAYVTVEQGGKKYILAEELAQKRFAIGSDAVLSGSPIKGSELIGKAYKPVFPYYAEDTTLEQRENGWKVYGADFVTTEDGTGIVHIAPAFGDDDMKLGEKESLPFVQHVTTGGVFKPEVSDFAGVSVKPKDDHQSGDVAIIKYLAGKGVLFAKEKIIHSYPHCWRCDTPLLNYASSSWFIKVTAFKDRLVEANNNVSWVPKEMGEGRFGKWLLGARDWAISRSRFWGAPLPVWRNEESGELFIPGSVSELKEKIGFRNTYLVMRHGEADSNAQNILSGKKDNPHHVTEKGKKQVAHAVEKLKGTSVDVVFVSPFVRTKETAEMVKEALGLTDTQIVVDERIGEIDTGDFNNTPIDEYRAYFKSTAEKFSKPAPNGESLRDVRRRVGEFLYEIDAKYEGKTILIISHEYPIWQLYSVAEGWDERGSIQAKNDRDDFVETGSVNKISFARLPVNESFETDLHRPYIDEIELTAKDGTKLKRVPEVFDCWVESGSMPFASRGYVGKALPDFDPNTGVGFPADFIAEGQDQTRGWFYSLIVLGVALFGKSPFKNVVVNGVVLAGDGQKMSKRLKNYPDPMEVVETYGMDALRLYFLGSPLVKAEDVSFSEKGVDEVMKKNIGRLENVVMFYQMFSADAEATTESPHVLDRWIVSTRNNLIASVTASLTAYQFDRAVRALSDFIDDLSTWYVRRSRDRFKGEDREDAGHARRVLRETLSLFSQVSAPFIPFTAESVYQIVKQDGAPKSVHLTVWPVAGEIDETLLSEMKTVREVVSLAFEARTKAKIKVRQPLASLTIKTTLPTVLLEQIAEEVNVKEVRIGETKNEEVLLDTVLTPELIEEGYMRDVLRHIQEKRKDAGLETSDYITLTVVGNKEVQTLISSMKKELERVAQVSRIEFEEKSEMEPTLTLGDMSLSVSIKKV
ncbi:MAG: class I tRNA ligase family protein [Candidatus Paceibacterota bacterium]